MRDDLGWGGREEISQRARDGVEIDLNRLRVVSRRGEREVEARGLGGSGQAFPPVPPSLPGPMCPMGSPGPMCRRIVTRERDDHDRKADKAGDDHDQHPAQYAPGLY